MTGPWGTHACPVEKAYDLLRSVAGSREPDTRLSMTWIERPGARLPDPGPPAGDAFADGEHGGWRPVA